MFDFDMNGVKWMIKEVEQKTFWEDDHQEFKDNGTYYFGRCKVDTLEIWLWKDIASIEQKKKTLYHELMHAYIYSYISFNDVQYDIDTFCDISANSHNLIHNIVDNYFRMKYGIPEEDY